MPNWCDNFAKIEHKNKTAIDRVVKAFRAGMLCSEFIPIPEELANTKSPNTDPQATELEQKYGHKDWYDFCVSKWGTKWDIGGDDMADSVDDHGDKFVYLTFSSAWAPPVGLYEKLSSEGYHVTGYYYEPSGPFTGVYRSESGDECYEIPKTSKEVKEQIPAELDDMFCISEQMEDEENELDNLMGGE